MLLKKKSKDTKKSKEDEFLFFKEKRKVSRIVRGRERDKTRSKKKVKQNRCDSDTITFDYLTGGEKKIML